MAETRAPVLAAICGIYCGTCPSYLAPRRGDEERVRAVAERHGISVDEVPCDGCLSARVMQPCRECRHGFRSCAAAHAVTRCSECAEFPCDRLKRFVDVHIVDGVSHHRDIIEDLEYARTEGVAALLRHQAERARCRSCGHTDYWFSRMCTKCGASLT